MKCKCKFTDKRDSVKEKKVIGRTQLQLEIYRKDRVTRHFIGCHISGKEMNSCFSFLYNYSERLS